MEGYMDAAAIDTRDDLTRRAIIAAHDASCPGRCGYDVSTYPKLTTREQAIVAKWRADRDDYQGRYETAHDSRMHAEKRLDDMTREAGKSRESAEKAVARSETAEAAIQRVRNYAALLSATSNQRPEVVAVDVAWTLRHAIDGKEDDHYE